MLFSFCTLWPFYRVKPLLNFCFVLCYFIYYTFFVVYSMYFFMYFSFQRTFLVSLFYLSLFSFPCHGKRSFDCVLRHPPGAKRRFSLCLCPVQWIIKPLGEEVKHELLFQGIESSLEYSSNIYLPLFFWFFFFIIGNNAGIMVRGWAVAAMLLTHSEGVRILSLMAE